MQIKWKSCSQSERCTFGTTESLHWLFANNYQCWESCNRLNKVNEVLGEETARLQELVYLSLMHMKLAFIDSYVRYWYPNRWHDWYVLTPCCFFCLVLKWNCEAETTRIIGRQKEICSRPLTRFQQIFRSLLRTNLYFLCEITLSFDLTPYQHKKTAHVSVTIWPHAKSKLFSKIAMADNPTDWPQVFHWILSLLKHVYF